MRMYVVARRCRLLLLLALLPGMAARSLAQAPAAPGETVVTGVVRDGKTPLAGATITVLENKLSTISSDKGEFTFRLRPGDYTFEVHYIGYKTQVRRLTVTGGRGQHLAIDMPVESKMLGEVSVQATSHLTTVKALLGQRRNSANIQDAIGAVQIEKSASITTAQALQRVTGVTVKDGKYITVRGLTDRNVVVELNGSRLAGADASRSSVAVDLIPAQLLDNIVVIKSVTPDKPGDANAAVVEIQTKSIPDHAFFVASAQTGWSGNIGPLGYYNSYPDGKLGFFGQQVQHLDITSAYQNLVTEYTARGYSAPLGTLGTGFTQAILASNVDAAHYAEAVRIAHVMQQGFSPYLTTQPAQSSPDQVYGLTYGNRFHTHSGKDFGLILGINYYNRTTANVNGQNNLYSVNEPATSGATGPNIVYPNELQMVPIYHLRENTGDHLLNFGGLVTLAFRFNPYNSLSFTYNANAGAEAVASMESGTANPNLTVTDPNLLPVFADHQSLHDFILHTTRRTLSTYQFKGDHRFRLVRKASPWQLNYSIARSVAFQDDPDYRETRLKIDSLGRIPNPAVGLPQTGPSQFIFSEYQYTYFAESDRYYRTLNETNDNDKIDLTIPIKLWRRRPSTVKTGGYYYDRTRRYEESLFLRSDNSPVSPNANGGYSQVPGDLTTLNGNLDTWAGPTEVGILPYQNVTEGSSLVPGYLYTPQAGITTTASGQLFINSYNAREAVTAFYAMADLNLDTAWRVVGGVRLENTSFQSTPDTTNANFANLTGIYDVQDFNRQYVTNYLAYHWLPSGSLIYRGIRNLNLRLAYSRTLIRPEINEIVLSAQRDPIQQLTIYGNKNLVDGVFSNYDFRTDWFIGEDELVSGSVFYKTVSKQLERVYTSGAIDDFGFVNSYVTFRNNPSTGYVYGMELELRKNLSMWFPAGKFFYIGANVMLAHSQTRLDTVEHAVIARLDRNASWYRPLVDQPNLALNLNLDFDYPRWGTQFNVLFNKTGKRLSDINSDGSPNIYEYPQATLDVVLGQRISKHWEFKAFGKNLLGGMTYYRYTDPGNTKTYGIYHLQYIRRAFNYGSVFTFGLKYTF